MKKIALTEKELEIITNIVTSKWADLMDDKDEAKDNGEDTTSLNNATGSLWKLMNKLETAK